MAHPLYDVIRERDAQDAEHGGPAHDDTHTAAEWAHIARTHLDRAQLAAATGDHARYRYEMVRVAAVCVAALESNDRKAGR